MAWTWQDIAALVVRIQQGERSAMDTLLVLLEPMVQRTARRYAHGDMDLFKDLCQEGRLAQVEIVPRVRPEKGLVRFFAGHVRGRMLNYIRDRSGTLRIQRSDWAQRRGAPVVVSLAETIPYGEHDTREIEAGLSTIQPFEDSLTIAEWMQKLPEKERRAVELYYAHGYNQRETATRLGVSQMTISRWLRHAIQVLLESAGD